MPWSTVAKYLLVFAVLGGAVWWISDGRYSAGKLDGETDGYRRGYDDATKLADKELLRLLAEGRETAERVRREAQDAASEEQRRHEAVVASERQAADAALAATRARYDAAAARLRALEARGPVRPVDSRSRVPEARPAEPATATAGRVLSGALRDAVEGVGVGLHAAEELGVRYGQCTRAYEGWRTGKVRG